MKQIKTIEPKFNDVNYNYHQIFTHVKKTFGSKTKSEIDNTFNLHGVNDENIRLLVMSALLSLTEESDYKSKGNLVDSRTMKKVAKRFFEEIYYQTTDQNDSIALNNLGINTLIGKPTFYEETLKNCSVYSVDNIREAIKKGVDLNLVNSNGDSLLTDVLANRRFDVAELLIQNGADVNFKFNGGTTALFYLTEGDEDKLEWLNDHGADVNVTDDNGQSALFYLLCRDLKISKMLIDAGANVNIRDNNGYTVLMTQKFNIINRDSYVNESELIDALNLLLESGAKLRFEDGNNSSPLVQALKYHYTDYAKLLIKAGADVNYVDKFSQPALYYALEDFDLTKLLIEHGADVNIKSEQDVSMLFFAAQDKNIPVMKLLLKSGAEIDTITQQELNRNKFNELRTILTDMGIEVEKDPNILFKGGIIEVSTINLLQLIKESNDICVGIDGDNSTGLVFQFKEKQIIGIIEFLKTNPNGYNDFKKTIKNQKVKHVENLSEIHKIKVSDIWCLQCSPKSNGIFIGIDGFNTGGLTLHFTLEQIEEIIGYFITNSLGVRINNN